MRNRKRIAAFFVSLGVLCLTEATGAPPQPATSTAQSPVAGSNGDAKATPKVGDGEKTGSVPKTADVNTPKPLLLDNDQLRQFLKWQESQETPAYNITSIVLEGTVMGDERARLQVTVQVQINHADEWIRVPLGLHEATLLAPPAYKPPSDGEARPPQTRSTDPAAGLDWYFRGRGLHELKFPVNVPLRKAHPERRLQLRLPPSPAAASKLVLKVPDEPISLAPIEKAYVSVRRLNNSNSEVEVYGLGSRLDLSWQPLPDRNLVQPQLQATTLIWANVSAESAVIEAHQRVVASQGSIDSLVVRLPRGFELVDVTGEQVREYHATRPGTLQDLSKRNAVPTAGLFGVGGLVWWLTPSLPSEDRVTVSLREATPGPVNLKWTLSTDTLGTGDGTWTLEGFAVENARRQTGFVGVSTFDGFHVLGLESQDRFVHRVDVGVLRTLNEFKSHVAAGEIQAAFRFLKQPFALSLEVQTTDPHFTVSPHYIVKISADRIDLEAVVGLNIYRGAISELSLAWPNWKQEGWQVKPSAASDVVDDVWTSGEAARSDVDLHFARPKARADGEITVRFSAQLAIADAGAGFAFSLPTVLGTRAPVALTVVHPENLELAFEPHSTTHLRPVPPGPQESVPAMAEFRGLPRSDFLIEDSATPKFTAKATVHEQSVRTETLAEVQWTGQRLQVSQRFLYEVAYAHLAFVRLKVPKELKNVKFTLHADSLETPIPLEPTWSNDPAVDSEAFQRVRLTLDEPRIRKFEVTAHFSVDVPETDSDGGPVEMRLPLLQPAEFTPAATRVRTTDTARVSVVPQAGEWKQEPSSGDAAQWAANGLQPHVGLRVSESAEGTSQNYVVPLAKIESTLFQNGELRTRAVYEVERAGTRIVLRLPDGVIDRPQFRWDDQELNRVPSKSTDPNAAEYEFDLSELPSRERHVLEVVYHSTLKRLLGWSDAHQLLAPQFPASVRVERTLWDVVLPARQHLFVHPRDYASQFSWQREGLFWSRVVRGGSAYGSPGVLEKTRGGLVRAFQDNAYRFTCFGPPRPLSFRSMSQSGIVALGAGLTWIVAFVLLRIPAARHVLTFLTLALGVSVVALWYVEPVQVLLQPSILGLLLAMIAVTIDNSIRRDQYRRPVTVASGSDLAVAGSSLVRSAAPAAANPNDRTVSRPAPAVAGRTSSVSSASGGE